jgi:hypothetical protein
MFVNLSRRSQSLVERQLRLIDDLEQGEQDPERLANLFQMDHLATRMRRNSENLLVLAGHDLSRQRTDPMPVVDVLRAAVSEIEQYERVAPNIQPGVLIRGPAVTDVVHLLSELAENATAFSPADTPVAVSGHLLHSGGALLEITDQGVGMDAEDMAHANWRLDNPPVVDVAVSRRMGLFVVARLAARHGIRVRLRSAGPRGLTALVWLPDDVIVREDGPATLGFRRFQPLPGVTPGLAAAPGGGELAAAPVAASPGRGPLPSAWGQGNGGGSVPAPGQEIPPRVPAAGDENRLPIFESVESDWFRRGRHGAGVRPRLPGPDAGWSSPGDAGWEAAEVAQVPVFAGTTGAGLPKRVPKANLVPGGVTAAPAPPAPPRSAARARDRLASFQQGIMQARAAERAGEDS